MYRVKFSYVFSSYTTCPRAGPTPHEFDMGVGDFFITINVCFQGAFLLVFISIILNIGSLALQPTASRRFRELQEKETAPGSPTLSSLPPQPFQEMEAQTMTTASHAHAAAFGVGLLHGVCWRMKHLLFWQNCIIRLHARLWTMHRLVPHYFSITYMCDCQVAGSICVSCLWSCLVGFSGAAGTGHLFGVLPSLALPPFQAACYLVRRIMRGSTVYFQIALYSLFTDG